MGWAILDSSIFMGHWEQGLYENDLAFIRRKFVLRHSAVVLSELRRGARNRGAHARVNELIQRASVVYEPSARDWWEAGLLIQRIGDEEGWDIYKRRAFQNDSLLALTARRHGSRVVTNNRADFEILSTHLKFGLLLL